MKNETLQSLTRISDEHANFHTLFQIITEMLETMPAPYSRSYITSLPNFWRTLTTSILNTAYTSLEGEADSLGVDQIDLAAAVLRYYKDWSYISIYNALCEVEATGLNLGREYNNLTNPHLTVAHSLIRVLTAVDRDRATTNQADFLLELPPFLKTVAIMEIGHDRLNPKLRGIQEVLQRNTAMDSPRVSPLQQHMSSSLEDVLLLSNSEDINVLRKYKFTNFTVTHESNPPRVESPEYKLARIIRKAIQRDETYCFKNISRVSQNLSLSRSTMQQVITYSLKGYKQDNPFIPPSELPNTLIQAASNENINQRAEYLMPYLFDEYGIRSLRLWMHDDHQYMNWILKSDVDEYSK